MSTPSQTAPVPETVFSLPVEDQEQYDEIITGLRRQIKPNGFLEEKLFLAYCWAMFQADRARGLEAVWQDRWMNDADNEKVLRTMERIAKYRQAHERSAERARRELSKVQHDAYCANQPNAVLKSVGLEKEKLSVLLPVAEIRKHEFKLCNATRVAGELIHGLPDWQHPLPGNPSYEPRL